MNYRQIVFILLFLSFMSAVIAYNAGILNVIYKCDNAGKYERADIVLMCTVKDKNMVGTNLSWSNHD